MKYGVGYEESRHHVYGVVQMSQEDDYAEENGNANEEVAQVFVLPENQSHQKRYAGVSGKKQVAAESQLAQNVRVNDNL